MQDNNPKAIFDDWASQGPQRLAKTIAAAGLCSRRDAEKWIVAGRVSVDGQVITSPACNVSLEQQIIVDGKPLPKPDRPRLFRYYKPTGLVTTARDEKGRATVFDNLPASLPRLISIGRLDINSEGLLLLTNSGALARHLELPSTGWVRRYRVRVHGIVDPKKLHSLADGITIEGVHYGAVHAEIETQQKSNAWLLVSIREGKNREVRRIMEHLGYAVNRLIRTAYGPFQLGQLAIGDVSEVSPRIVRQQLGVATPGAVAKSRKPGRPRPAAKQTTPNSRQADNKAGDGQPSKRPTLTLKNKKPALRQRSAGTPTTGRPRRQP